jgi:DNA polymerase/3'-5' exonuclease PolX
MHQPVSSPPSEATDLLRIPRDEVEWMASVVNDELQKIIVGLPASPPLFCSRLMHFHEQPGAEYTIVGGHRRGKPTSGDVDIIFTHPEPNKEKGALEELLKRLEKANMGKSLAA